MISTLKKVSIKNYSAIFSLFTLLLSSLSFAHQTYSDLKLLTLNTWQFPYGIISKNNSERAIKLTDTINSQNNEFDVIAFQELWSNKKRNFIYDRIKTLYPNKFEDNQWGVLGLGLHSGLAIYSKYPINRQMQYTYKHYRGYENFAKKGILGVEINFHGQPVYIFTTHLQAGAGGCFFEFMEKCKPSTFEISALQLLEARKEISDFVKDKEAPIFLIGDLNITAGNEEYQNALKALVDATDTFNPEKSEEKGTSWNDYPSHQRIDYIMTLGKKSEGYSKIINYFGRDVTDHLGVVGTFKIAHPDETLSTPNRLF